MVGMHDRVCSRRSAIARIRLSPRNRTKEGSTTRAACWPRTSTTLPVPKWRPAPD